MPCPHLEFAQISISLFFSHFQEQILPAKRPKACTCLRLQSFVRVSGVFLRSWSKFAGFLRNERTDIPAFSGKARVPFLRANMLPEDGDTPERLLRAAEHALYCGEG